MSKKKHEVKFYCNACDPRSEKPMIGEGLREHLKTVHSIYELKGTQQGVSFLDGEFGYSNVYEVKIGTVTLTKVSSGPRCYDS